MYKVKELIDKGLNVKGLDKELQDDIEALETLSDNYFNDDKDALDFDSVLAKELAKHMKEDKPKAKPEPKKEEKFKKGDKVKLKDSALPKNPTYKIYNAGTVIGVKGSFIDVQADQDLGKGLFSPDELILIKSKPEPKKESVYKKAIKPADTYSDIKIATKKEFETLKEVFPSLKINDNGYFIPSSANDEKYIVKKAKDKGVDIKVLEFQNDGTDLYDVYIDLKESEPKPKKEKKAKKDKSEKMSIPECDELVKKWTDAYKKRQANKDKPKPTPAEKFERKAESSANAVVSSVKGSDKEIKAEVKKDVKVIIKGLLSGFKTILMNEDEDTLKSFNKELEALIKKYKK